MLAKKLKLTPAMKPRLITKKLMELTLTLKMKKSASQLKTMKSSRGAHRWDRGHGIIYTRELLTPKTGVIKKYK